MSAPIYIYHEDATACAPPRRRHTGTIPLRSAGRFCRDPYPSFAIIDCQEGAYHGRTQRRSERRSTGEGQASREDKEGRVKNRHETNQRPRTCAGHVQRSRPDSAVAWSPPPDPRGLHSPTRGRRVAAFRRVQLPARARRPVMTSLSKRQLPLALSSSAGNQHVTSLPPMWIVNLW